MSIGIPPTKADVDAMGTALTKNLNIAFDQIRELEQWLSTQGSAGLVTLGYTSGEAAVILSAFSDLDQLRTIYEGSATLGSVKDFRTFAKQLYGFGF